MGKIRGPDAFAVVAIGASAGGLRAFEELLHGLCREPGMAFVLVPHLAPQFKSHLAEILARSTDLPVREIKNGDKVAPDHIYILPPNRTLRMKDLVLRLFPVGRQARGLKLIDGFFRSLAEDRREKAIGVLLSGEGSDGTEGLRAIKDGGGATFAQNVESAAHRGMPRSAAISGYADFVLPPSEIGKRLRAARPEGEQARGEGERSSEPKGGESLFKILELLRTAKGTDFAFYKRSMMRRRIQRRMTLGRFRDPRKYVRALESDPAAVELLYGDILISVTSFFREPESFAALKTTMYSRILKNRSPDAPIRVWVPACSTGEEAYSHAMNLVEFLDENAPALSFKIFATDVNPAVIERARAGLYARKATAGLSCERLRRFFSETADGYRVVPALRERCVFAVQNLVRDPPFMNLDMISCRNLLIYFGPALQQKALRAFQYALKPRGILMLGRSEAVGNFSGRFSPLDAGGKAFFERTSVSKARLDFSTFGLPPGAAFVSQDPDDGRGGFETAQAALDLDGRLDDVLPARYRPDGVIVNAELEILRFLGDASAFLRPAPGRPSMNLRGMASGEFLLEIRSAIYAAQTSSRAVRKEIAAPQFRGVPRRVRVEVLPIKDFNPHDKCFLVLFEELVVEAQESTNAKLKSANEDLLSSNEELQSINEEYETTKEELQSSNEELIASAEEVGRGSRILSRANNDLSNLLASIDIPVVLLDSDLAIHRFTPAAAKTLGLASDKIGRSVLEVGLPLRLPNLESLLADVIRTGVVQTLEVQDEQGRWYSLVLRPYRTDKSRAEKSRIEGAVMAFIDIQDRKLSEKNSQRLAAVLLESNDSVIIVDLKDRITAWNKGAQKMYGYTEAQALGMDIGRLMPENKRVKARELVRASATQVETQRRTKDGRTLDVLLTVSVLRDADGRPIEVAVTERDVTELKRAARESRILHARVISAQDTERRRLARELHDGVGQILSGVKYRLQALPAKMTLSGEGEAKILEVGGFLDHAIAEIRRVSQNLMPSELEDLGLEPALLALCREFKERSGVAVTVRTVPAVVAPDLALALFRIVQEALNNIGKHSKATMAAVCLSRERKGIVLSVSDNGIGFKLGGKRPSFGRGLGLGNMRERAESVGGFFEIHSTPGTGTTLKVRIAPRGSAGAAA